MRALPVVLDPPQVVVGHPIEILAVPRGSSAGVIILISIRVTTSTGPVEAHVRYDAGKRITIDTIPESNEAYQLLLAARGDRAATNPLAEAVEAAFERA